MNVADWLQALGLEQYEAAFRENDVNAELLLTLTVNDLKEIGITSFGHCRRLLEAIAALRPGDAPVEDAAGSSTNLTRSLDTSKTTAERRPLSVMFATLSAPPPFPRASIPRIYER